MNSSTPQSRALPAAAHTPGPWHIGIPSFLTEIALWEVSVFDASSVTVAMLRATTREQVEANARLIAACPELLAALIHARALVASRDVVLDRAALRMYDEAICSASLVEAEKLDSATAHAAIAKAKGL